MILRELELESLELKEQRPESWGRWRRPGASSERSLPQTQSLFESCFQGFFQPLKSEKREYQRLDDDHRVLERRKLRLKKKTRGDYKI